MTSQTRDWRTMFVYSRESGFAELRVAIVFLHSHVVAFLMTLERDVGEPAGLVGTHWAAVYPLRFVVVHHVLLQECRRTEHLAADIAWRFADSVHIPHVIEERSLGRTHFRADVALEGLVFGLSNAEFSIKILNLNVNFQNSPMDVLFVCSEAL